jgi:hypothetical protein
MIWTTIFLTLTIVEGIYLWFQWDKISQVIEVAKLAQDLTGVAFKDNKAYNKAMDFKTKVIFFVLKFKKLIWLPIGLLLIANLIVASIISPIISLILYIVV